MKRFFRLFTFRRQRAGEIVSPSEILLFFSAFPTVRWNLVPTIMLTLFLPVKPRYALLKMAAATTIAKRAVGKLRPETTAMLLVDIQERFRPLIYNSETVVQTARYMTSVAKALDIPVVVTQQYTKVFGATVKECFAEQQDLEATPIYEKKLFSMCTEEVASHLSKLNRSSYIMFGIEAHVCVQQTALDLLEVRHHSFAVA